MRGVALAACLLIALPASSKQASAKKEPPSKKEPSAKAVQALRKGLAAYQAARFDDAIESLTQAMTEHPGWKTAAAFRAMCRWTSGDEEGAQEDADIGLQLKPDGAEAFTARGLSRFVVKQMALASEDFASAAAADPKFALAHFGLGSVLSSQNRPKDALKHLNRAVELAPEAAVVRVVRGTVRDKLRDFAGAAEDYTAVLRIAPAFEWAHFYRGRAYREMRKYPQAVEDFTAFLKKNPDHEDALYLRSNAYFLLNDQDSAVKDLDHLIAVNPRHGLAFANRGVARSEMGDTNGALSDLRKAKVLMPAKASKIEEQIQRLSGGGDSVAMEGELTGVAAKGSLPQSPLPAEEDLSR